MVEKQRQQKVSVISGNANTPFRLEGRDDGHPKFYVSRHRSARYSLNSAFVFRQVILTRFKVIFCHGAGNRHAARDNGSQRISHL
jgi:hypothetical protein